MDAERYLKERVEGQIRWLSDKSGWNQRWFKRLRLAEIGLAASVPVLVGYADSAPAIKFAVALAGALVAIIASAVSLWKLQELWIQYRVTAEALEREKMLFLTQSPPYDTPQAFAELVGRVEALLGSENVKWAEQMRPQAPVPAGDGGKAAGG